VGQVLKQLVTDAVKKAKRQAKTDAKLAAARAAYDEQRRKAKAAKKEAEAKR